MSTEPTTDRLPLRARLRAALSLAIKARDRQAISALRSALAAIDNAEAVDIGECRAGAIETSPLGLGSTEVARRDLTESDIEQLVRTEVADRVHAAAQYDDHGRPDQAEALRAQAETLTELL